MRVHSKVRSLRGEHKIALAQFQTLLRCFTQQISSLSDEPLICDSLINDRNGTRLDSFFTTFPTRTSFALADTLESLTNNCLKKNSEVRVIYVHQMSVSERKKERNQRKQLAKKYQIVQLELAKKIEISFKYEQKSIKVRSSWLEN